MADNLAGRVLYSYLTLKLFSSSDIKNNAWVTANNDFWVTSEAKIIGKSHHEWPQNRYSR